MIRAQIADAFAFGNDRLLIRFSASDSDHLIPKQVAAVVVHGHLGAVLEYAPYEEPDLTTRGTGATLSLTDGEARALLETLAAHFGGTGPAKAARDDFLHERGRVDKLTDALIDLAGTLAEA